MSYARILERCLNTPLNIEASKLELLTSEVFINLLVNESAIDRTQKTPEPVQNNLVLPKGVRRISVNGSLVNKNGAGASGVTSYAGIRNQISYIISDLLDSEVTDKPTTVLFDIASSGGESAGNFPLSDLIHSLPEKYGLKTVAFTDSTAASAAYAIFSACQETYAVDTATLGSIGTLLSLVDVTQADKKMGVKYEIMRSKEDKATYNPHEEISDKVRAEARTMLKVWDDKFNNTIHKYIPKLSIDDIVALKGKSFPATQAKELGLVQHIVSSIEDVFADLQPTVSEETVINQPQFPHITIGNTTMNLEEALAQNIALKSELESLKASSKIDLQTAVTTERNRVLKVMETGNTLNIPATRVVNAISKGWELDTVSEVFTEIAAAQQELTAVVTGSSPVVGGVNQIPAAGAGSVNSVSITHLQQLANKQQAAAEKELANGVLSLDDIVNAMAEIGGERLQQQQFGG